MEFYRRFKIHRGGGRRVLAHGHQTCTTPAKSSSAFSPTQIRSALAAPKLHEGGTASSPKARPTCSTSPPTKIAIGNKLGIDATKKLSGEGFKRHWPALIKIDETVRNKIEGLCGEK